MRTPARKILEKYSTYFLYLYSTFFLIFYYFTTLSFITGEEFKNHSHNLKGNNDFLSLTKPQIIEEIHKVLFSIICAVFAAVCNHFFGHYTDLKKFRSSIVYDLLTNLEVKMARHWSCSFLACLYTRTNTQKVEWGQYPAILAERAVFVGLSG